MSNNSNKRSGFPGAGEDHELDADFDAWDKGFDDLVGDEEDGTRVDPKLAGGGEFEFELSFDDDVEGGFTLDDDVDDGFTLDVGEAAEPGPSGAATLDESMPAGSADDAAGGESPTGLGELLGASLELDEIDDAEAFPPPFGGDSGVYDPSAADPVTGAAGSDLEDGEQQVYTSAARPFEATDPAHPGGRMSKVLASFQAVEDEDDDDDFDPFADPEEGASTQITKVVEVDEELLAAAIPDEETDRVKVRRAPTIVRRDDLERLRAEHAARAAAARQEEEDEADDDAFGVQVTKMLSEEQLESLAEEAAPEIEVSVDDDFYDDIEIGESAGGGASSGVPEPAEETESAATPATPTSPGAGRRVSQHVVRRGGSQPTPVVQRPTPVVRPRRRRTRTSQYELSAQLDESRSLDPETTLDLRVMVDGGGEGVSRPGQDENREAEIQAIIDRAAQELRSQGAQPSAGTPPGEAASEDGFEDFEFDWEPDGEATPVPAPVPGAPPVAAFDEVDAIPGLPDPILPAGAITDWPALDPAALAIPAEHVALDAAAKIQDARGLLARFEAALEGPGDDPDTVSLGLAAGWLGEQAGAFERARAHYERALALSPGLLPALRGLRRAERRLGQWDHVIARLEQESERVSAQERRALDQLRAELLIACGERERAAQVSAATAQDAGPDSLRGLMAQVELAIVDGREGDAAAALGQIAEQVGGGRLRCSLRRAQGLMTERAGGDALAAYTAAAADGARTTPLAAARAAHSSAGATPEAAATARATVRAIARAAAETGAGRAPGYEAAMAWRRSLWAERDGDDGRERAVALAEAVRLAPDEALLAAELAAVEAGPGGDHARAVELCLHLGETAATEAARAAALATAAVHLAHLGRDADAARARAQALALDPSYPIAAVGAGTSAGHLDADAVATQVTMDLETLRSDPGAAFERVRAATLFLAQGKGDEAVQLLQAGVAAGASPAVMHQVLDETLVRTGQVHARARLLAGLADDPAATVDPEVLLWRAAEASEAHVAEVLAAHAGDDEADAEHLRLVREGALAGALEAWNRVLDGDPGALAAHLCSIRLAAALGDPDVLDDALERAQAAVREPAQAATLALRRVEVATGRPATLPGEDPGRLDDLLRQAAEVAGADARVTVARVVLAAADGRPAAAAAALADRADQLGDGDRALAVRTRAAALFLDLADDPAQAAALIEAVLSAKPGASEAQELLRAAHLRLGHSAPMELPRAPEADDSADAAVRGAGDDAFARLVREAEVCLDQLGDPVRALELYDRALTQRGDDDRSWPLVREGVTRAAAAAGASERLRGLAERARARAGTGGPALAWAYLALAEVAAEAEAQSHYLAARAADSDRGPAWAMAERALERDHIGAGRWQALWDLYTEVADLPALSAQAPREALATRLERARLAERLERPDDDIQACYRDALGLDEGCLPALFRVYHESRRSDSAALAAAGVDPAAIASAVAAYMHARGGATTEAALLTRGGETLLAAGQLEDAIERFRQADMAAGGDASEPGGAELGRGYSAAHYGWRVAALRGQLWDDAAEAALRESRLPEAADERAELAHLAGVILMDKALHGEQALPALEAALEAAPDDDDTFARLNVLLDEQGEHERQAELLRARLARERDPGVKARLHLDLAELARNFLDDRAGAGDHLRALLALRPGDRDAITTLADLAWEQGDWAAAAEHLIARARVETDPALRKTLFFRLGTIYADRLPEPALAIKSFKQVLRQDKDDEGALAGLARVALASGDAKLALAAAERLVRLARSDDARVERLHRVAAIYRDGLDDPARAERAYRLALDRAPTNDAALAALIGFYEDRGDTRSIRVHLDRVIGAMRLRLDDDSADGVAYRVIARAMRARHRAGVGGSLAPARCAAELALALDAGDADERGLAAETVRGLVGLDQPGGDDLLRPQAVPPAARQLFAALGDRLAKHIGADLRRHGVSRGQRVRDPGAAAVMACEAVAGELGVEPPAVYLSEARPQAFALEPTSPPSIILGAELMAAMGPDELRFVTGRALGLERGGVLAPVSLDEDAFAVFLAALLRQFDPEFELPGIAAAAVEEEAQRLRRVVSAGLVQELLPVALGVMGAGLDPAALRAGLLETGDRVGLLACGSVAAAARWLGRVHGHDGVAAALGDPEVAALVRFAVGPDHAALRGLMQR